jgi:hypothetical protein
MSPERKQEAAAEVEDTGGSGPQRIADTDARRIQKLREDAGVLNATLARLRCPECGTSGCWDAVSSPKPEKGEDGKLEPRERWYKCRGCQRNTKVVLPEV